MAALEIVSNCSPMLYTFVEHEGGDDASVADGSTEMGGVCRPGKSACDELTTGLEARIGWILSWVFLNGARLSVDRDVVPHDKDLFLSTLADDCEHGLEGKVRCHSAVQQVEEEPAHVPYVLLPGGAVVRAVEREAPSGPEVRELAMVFFLREGHFRRALHPRDGRPVLPNHVEGSMNATVSHEWEDSRRARAPVDLIPSAARHMKLAPNLVPGRPVVSHGDPGWPGEFWVRG